MIDLRTVVRDLLGPRRRSPSRRDEGPAPEMLRFSRAAEPDDLAFVMGCRRSVAERFVRGAGLEVGAGTRPFPLPAGAHCFYGDIRDATALERYFDNVTSAAAFDGRLDAQTFEGIASASQDFVISAHVIEHLENPIGAIEQALRVLKPGGILLLVVPDRRHTFDRDRPGTMLDHLLADARDGGASTRLQAYEDHARYVHRTLTGEILDEATIAESSRATMEAGMDVHFHCWTTEEFRAMLDYCCRRFGGRLVAWAGEILNENMFVVEKLDQARPSGRA